MNVSSRLSQPKAKLSPATTADSGWAWVTLLAAMAAWAAIFSAIIALILFINHGGGSLIKIR